MKGDFSRETFDPRKHYGKVLMQQGRVQMDADWNEQQAIHQHRIETETLDVVGRTGAPVDHAGFGVSVTADDKDLVLSPGRYYLDGTLYEIDEPTAVKVTVQGSGQMQLQSLVVDGCELRIGEWIEIFTQDLSKRKLARIAKTGAPSVIVVNADIDEFRHPQHVMIRRVVTYTTQPDCPEPPRTNRPAGADIANLTLPNGVYQVYLDGWQRHITALHDSSIRETALGGPDTAARAQTVWQAKIRSVQPRDGIQADEYLAVSEIFNQVRRTDLSAGNEIEIAQKKERYQKNLKGIADILGVSCNSEPFGTGDTAASSGRMRAQAKSPQNQGDLCNIPPSAGYQRLENHLYRVEVHQGGTRATAKFKWSRDNGSVVTRIEDMKGKFVTVHDLGPDNDMGFANGQWVEIVDDWTELSGESGQLVRIKSINQAQRVIEMENLPDAVDQARNPKLRRWDQIAPQDYADGLDMSANWMPLGEEGIEIQFEEGNYKTGDYWLIPARTATGDIEWPGCSASGGGPAALPPLGIEHHYCPLTLLYALDGKILVISDCRRIFPPLTETSSFFYIGGDGQEVMPDLVQGSVPALEEPLRVGVANIQGPVAGARVRFRVIPDLMDAPSGTLSADTQGQDVIATTGEDGIAECEWSLDSIHHVQQVEANLLDVDDWPIHLPIHFSANLSEADHVAYDPGRCSTLRNKKTVQDAIDTLRSLTSLHYVSGDGQEAMPGKPLPQPLQVAVVNLCSSVGGSRVRFTTQVGGKIAETIEGLAQASHELDVQITGRRETAVVSCYWQPEPTPGELDASKTLTATLEVGPNATAHPPTQVVFTANLSIAEQVGYDPGSCQTLQGRTTVQAAIDRLRSLTSLHYVSGDGQEAMPGKPLPQPLRVAVVNLCKSAAGNRVRFTTQEGGKVAETVEGLARATNELQVAIAARRDDAVVSCYWLPDPRPGRSMASQALRAALEVGPHAVAHPPTEVIFTANLSIAEQVAYNPKDCPKLAEAGTVQDAVERLCRMVDYEDGIHIEKITVFDHSKPKPLLNDREITVDSLVEGGITILCDRAVDPRPIVDKRTCAVSIDVPFPINADDREMYGPGLFGYQSLTLDAHVGVKDKLIYWRPQAGRLKTRLVKLLAHMRRLDYGDRLLVRLILKGNFIFCKDDSDRRYLDGDTFGAMDESGHFVDIVSPHGNNRRGGDYEMWFWLRQPEVPHPPRVSIVRFISPERVIREVKLPVEPERPIKISAGDGTNTIEIVLTHPIREQELDKAIRVERYVSSRIGPTRPTVVPGRIKAMDDTTIRFDADSPTVMASKGQYTLTALGNPSADLPSVRAVDGTPLDGDFSGGPGADLVVPFTIE